LADEGEALLGEFGLEELIFSADEEISGCAGDGGDEVVDGEGLAVESALLVRIGCELDGCDGSSLLGDHGPEVAIVAGGGNGQQSLQRAGIEVGEKDG